MPDRLELRGTVMWSCYFTSLSCTCQLVNYPKCAKQKQYILPRWPRVGPLHIALNPLRVTTIHILRWKQIPNGNGHICAAATKHFNKWVRMNHHLTLLQRCCNLPRPPSKILSMLPPLSFRQNWSFTPLYGACHHDSLGVVFPLCLAYYCVLMHVLAHFTISIPTHATYTLGRWKNWFLSHFLKAQSRDTRPHGSPAGVRFFLFTSGCL